MSIARTIDGLEGAILIDATGAVMLSGGPVSSHSPEALAYLARTVGGNEGGNGENIANLIDGLVSDGVWSKLDALYIGAQQNATDALLNLVGTSFSLVTTGVVTFTPYAGWSGFNNDTSNLNTNLVPTTGNQFTQDNASFGAWSYAIVSETAAQLGQTVTDFDTDTRMQNAYTNGNFYTRLNESSATGSGGAVRTQTKGLAVGDRSSSTGIVQYWNGVNYGFQSGPSQAMNPAPFIIGHPPTNTHGTAQTISEAHVGGSLGDAGQLALYNRLNTYMTAVTPWTPTQLTGLVAWYDAQDSSTLTLSGSNVTQWNDKSVNGYHASQSDPAQQPTLDAIGINGHPALYFDVPTGVRTLVATVPPDLWPSEVAVYFVTWQLDSVPLGHNTACPLYHTQDALPNPWSRRNTSLFIGDGPAQNYVEFATYDVVTAAPAYWGFHYTYATDHVDDWLNGVQVSNATVGAIAFASGATTFRIGSRIDNSPVVYGHVGEIIACTTLTEPERVNLEAYLKAKWGFT